jgi:hypothetical protein
MLAMFSFTNTVAYHKAHSENRHKSWLEGLLKAAFAGFATIENVVLFTSQM